MKKISLIIIMAAVSIVMAVTGCDSIDPGEPLDHYIDRLGKIEQPPHNADVRAVEELSDDGECRVYSYRVELGFNELFSLDPENMVIWPGSLIDGATIKTGQYRPIMAERKPLTISCSIKNTGESVAATMTSPCLSESREKLNEIIFRNRDVPLASYMNYTCHEIYDREHLLREFGIHADASFLGIFKSWIDDIYHWESYRMKTKILYKFIQVYYDCAIDIPITPEDFFADSVTAEDLHRQISGLVSPGYVAKINYGRMALFFIESEEDVETVTNAFEAGFKAAAGPFGHGGAEVTISTEDQDVINRCTIKAVIIGGDSQSAAAAVVDPLEFANYLTDVRNHTVSTPVSPLSYQVNYLCDNTVMQMVCNSEKKVTVCGGDGEPDPTTAPLKTNYKLIVTSQQDSSGSNPVSGWCSPGLPASGTNRFSINATILLKYTSIANTTYPVVYKLPDKGQTGEYTFVFPDEAHIADGYFDISVHKNTTSTACGGSSSSTLVYSKNIPVTQTGEEFSFSFKQPVNNVIKTFHYTLRIEPVY
ncbi:MAG: thiol-activated cytolysin family protein [Spirochaetales bacterium]|nr:thiol-activated cytolysin family protein [Spirochaetales bacterium]